MELNFYDNCGFQQKTSNPKHSWGECILEMKCESRKNVSPFVPRLRHLSVFRVGNKTCASRQSRTTDAR